MHKEKAIINYRVSTEDQARNGVSLIQQKNACVDYAERYNLTVSKIFHDDGVSAKTTKRKGLQDLIAHCSKHHKDIDYIIVYKIDRLSRNTNDYTTMCAMFAKMEIQLASTVEQIDETPMGKFMGTFMAANAQLDNDMKSVRVSSCMMEKFNQGKWYGAAPIGYLNSKDELGQKSIVADPKKAHLIKYIFTEFAKGIKTLEDIRITINKKGLTTVRGNTVSAQMMSAVIANTFYFGLMYSKRHDKYMKGIHEPLISEETFYTCQERLGHATGSSVKVIKKEVSEKFPLRNKVRCAFCLRPLTGGPSKGRGGTYYYYRCYYKECRKIKSVPSKKIHKHFLTFIETFTPSDKSLLTLRHALMDAWQDRYKELNTDRTEAEKTLQALDKEKLDLITLARKGILDDEEMKGLMEDHRKRVRNTLKIIENSNDTSFDMDTAISEIFPLLKDLPQLWKEASYEDKKVLQGLIFVEDPSYNGNEFTTPQLSLILAESKALEGGKPNRVDRTGFEPVTSSMPWKRATNCANGPILY